MSGTDPERGGSWPECTEQIRTVARVLLLGQAPPHIPRDPGQHIKRKEKKRREEKRKEGKEKIHPQYTIVSVVQTVCKNFSMQKTLNRKRKLPLHSHLHSYLWRYVLSITQ